jgi:PAS domain S-box-containing protein
VPPDIALDIAAAVAERSPDGMAVVDADGVIVFANARMADLSDYTVSQLIGTSVDVLVPSAIRGHHAGLRRAFSEAGEARPIGRGATLSMIRRDGSSIAVEIALAPVVVDGDLLVVAAVRDVGERLALERQARTTSELLALADERDRIARDLHDTVLQRLFGLGLELQALTVRTEPALAQQISKAVDELDLIIREIRTTVFTLGSAQRDGSFGQELGAVVAQSSRVLGFTPRVRIDGPIEAAMPPAVRTELLASLREMLGNVGRHAGAAMAEVVLTLEDDQVHLTVQDNGRGIDPEVKVYEGNGLRNIRERARSLGGECSVANAEHGGCVVHWYAPLALA